MLRDGDFFQLHVEAAGGKVEWWKDGELLPNMEKGLSDRACRYVNVDQPNRTQLLEPGTYKRREEDFPPNAGRHSYLGGRCQVCHTHIHLFSGNSEKSSLGHFQFPQKLLSGVPMIVSAFQ